MKGIDISDRANQTYQIYALIDPRDNTTRYVGMSRNAQRRLFQHLLGDRGNEQKNTWLLELLKEGIYPILRILETIDAEEVEAYAIACEREQYWISECLLLGMPLLNISIRGHKNDLRFRRPHIKWIEKEPSEVEESALTLRELREWAVLTQEELAQLMGVSVTTVSHWETGNKVPRSSKVRQLAAALGVTSQDVIAAIKKTRTTKKQL
jgi:DNA-binding XRE family transcriptional regulator